MTYIAELVMAHGAGQGKNSDFMQRSKKLFEQQNIRCTLFNFDYMDKVLQTGKKRPPDTMPKLIARFKAEIAKNRQLPLFIGGKSMGGRVASMILQDTNALGALCFGYPFHPPGKPDKLRIDHFSQTKKTILILQGERDPFGKKTEILNYPLPGNIKIHYITDGEHSFKPLKSSAVDWEDNMTDAVNSAVKFIQSAI